MKRPALALLAGILMLTLMPGAAAASFIGSVDQSNTTDTASANSSNPLAQTFTAGKTGLLTQVQLIVQATSGDMTVSLQATTAGLPNGSVLATSSPTSPANVASWTAFTFLSPPVVVAGTQYALVWSFSGLGGVPTTNGGGNTYAGGQALTNAGTWVAVNGSLLDWAFKTLVDPQTTTLAWDHAQIVGGATTPLTLTETIVFPGLFDPAVEQVALPSWFTVTGVACSSQIAPADCVLANVAPAGSMNVVSNGSPVVVTLTGTASPLVGAIGTTGTGSAEGCMIYTGPDIAVPNQLPGGTCVTGSATVAVVAALGTPPPTATSSTPAPSEPGSSLVLLPMALLAFAVSSLLVVNRRTRGMR